VKRIQEFERLEAEQKNINLNEKEENLFEQTIKIRMEKESEEKEP
jgi:hypothetical protein